MKFMEEEWLYVCGEMRDFKFRILTHGMSQMMKEFSFPLHCLKNDR